MLFFASCTSVDEYANKFTDYILSAVEKSSRFKPVITRQRLSKHVVRLLQLKRRKWNDSLRTGYVSTYETAKINVMAAIRQHYRNMEYRLTFAQPERIFITFKKLRRTNNDICIDINGIVASNKAAAEIFVREFSYNFSIATEICSFTFKCENQQQSATFSYLKLL